MPVKFMDQHEAAVEALALRFFILTRLASCSVVHIDPSSC